jgi:hypothetical protein
MPLSYKETAAPAAEPLSLDEAKAQCAVDAGFTDDDPLLSSLIIAARQHIEKNVIHRAIFNRTMKLWLDHFPYPIYDGTVNPNDRHCLYGVMWHALAIRLPMPACVSVDSITYIDLNGVTQTLDPNTYFLDPNSEPARIVPKPGLYWPYTQSWLPNSVEIDYIAGTYGDGATTNTCPETIKQAMKLLISYWYNHRDSAESQPPKSIEMGVEALLAGEVFDTFGF